MEEKFKELAKRISESNHCVVFTGAGVSVESGIPPFRGENGVYNDINLNHLELSNYLKKPAECLKTIKSLLSKTGKGYEPNIGHKILGEWSEKGIVKSVITQNIDNLHQEGGSDYVIELHGNGKTMKCTECGNCENIDYECELLKCSKCDALSKPNFIFFGEQLPITALSEAETETMKCDLMIIIGCSGEVYPAAGLPMKAKNNGAYIIEINPTNSYYTARVADITIQGKSGEVLTKINEFI